MPRRLRLFLGSSMLVPPPWIDAVDAAPHVRQVDVIVVAATKADAIALLAARGVAASPRDERFRLNESANSVRQLRDVGIVGDEPVVIAFRGAVIGAPVVRVDITDFAGTDIVTFTRLGRWDYPAGQRHGLIVRRERPVRL